MRMKVEIILLVSVPVISIFIGSIISQFIALLYMRQYTLDYSNNLYQNQIEFSTGFTVMISNLLSRKMQKFPIFITTVNSYMKKVMDGQVHYNTKHIPSLVNVMKLYRQTEDPYFMQEFRNYPLRTTSWYHQNYSSFSELDTLRQNFLINAYKMAPLTRVIQYENRIRYDTNVSYIPLNQVGIGYDFDGFMVDNKLNSSLAIVDDPNCPKGRYIFDVRCRFWYMNSLDILSYNILAPKISQTEPVLYVSQLSCQRLRVYNTTTNEKKVHHVECIEVVQSSLTNLFDNVQKLSKQWYIIDPRSQSIVYNSVKPFNKTSLIIDNFSDVEFGHLEQPEEGKKLNDTINENYNTWVKSTVPYIDKHTMNTFNSQYIIRSYLRNGTRYQVILNPIFIADRIPDFISEVENVYGVQLEIAYLQINIISDSELQNFTNYLLYLENSLFISVSVILIIVSLISVLISIYYALQINKLVEYPISHLTRILKNIQEQGENLINMQQVLQKYERNARVIFQSKETKDLYESFYQVFQVLLLISENFFEENESKTLIGLCKKVNFLKQFQNYHAVGITHNNIGCILLNQGHFFQALEHFSQAIIYAKYSINQFSDANPNSQFVSILKQFCYNDLLTSKNQSTAVTNSVPKKSQTSFAQLNYSSLQNNNSQNSPKNNLKNIKNARYSASSDRRNSNPLNQRLKKTIDGKEISNSPETGGVSTKKIADFPEKTKSNQMKRLSTRDRPPSSQEQNNSARQETTAITNQQQDISTQQQIPFPLLQQDETNNHHNDSTYQRLDSKMDKLQTPEEKQEVKDLLTSLFHRKLNYAMTLIAFQETIEEPNKSRKKEQPISQSDQDKLTEIINLSQLPQQEEDYYTQPQIKKTQGKPNLQISFYNFWDEIKELLKDLLSFSQRMSMDESLEVIVLSLLSKANFQIQQSSKCEKYLERSAQIVKKIAQREIESLVQPKQKLRSYSQNMRRNLKSNFNLSKDYSKLGDKLDPNITLFWSNFNVDQNSLIKAANMSSQGKRHHYEHQASDLSSKQNIHLNSRQISQHHLHQGNDNHTLTTKSRNHISTPSEKKIQNINDMKQRLNKTTYEKQNSNQVKNQQLNQTVEANNLLNPVTVANQNINLVNSAVNVANQVVNANQSSNANQKKQDGLDKPDNLQNDNYFFSLNSPINSNQNLLQQNLQLQQNLLSQKKTIDFNSNQDLLNSNNDIMLSKPNANPLTSPKQKILKQEIFGDTVYSSDHKMRQKKDTANQVGMAQKSNKNINLESFFKLKRRETQQLKATATATEGKQSIESVIKIESLQLIIHFHRVEYLINQRNYKSAAEILTLIFENSLFIMSHYSYKLIYRLKQIFDMNNIKSKEINQVFQKFSMNKSQSVVLIFSCNSHDTNSFRTLQMASDMVNEVLVKKNDKLGIVLVDHEDGFIMQYMDFIFAKQVKLIIDPVISEIQSYITSKSAEDILSKIGFNKEDDVSSSELFQKSMAQSNRMIKSINSVIMSEAQDNSSEFTDFVSTKRKSIGDLYQIDENLKTHLFQVLENKFGKKEMTTLNKNFIKDQLIYYSKQFGQHWNNTLLNPNNQGDTCSSGGSFDSINEQEIQFQSQHQQQQEQHLSQLQSFNNQQYFSKQNSKENINQKYCKQDLNELDNQQFTEEKDQQNDKDHLKIQNEQLNKQYRSESQTLKETDNTETLIRNIQLNQNNQEKHSVQQIIDNRYHGKNNKTVNRNSHSLFRSQPIPNRVESETKNLYQTNQQLTINESVFGEEQGDSKEQYLNLIRRNKIFHLSIRKVLHEMFSNLIPYEKVKFNQFVTKLHTTESEDMDLIQKYHSSQSISNQKFIIYSTDEVGVIKNSLFESLCELLGITKIKLIILSNKKGNNFLEKEANRTFSFKGYEVIKLFYSINKINKYLSFQRDQISKYAYPTFIQHI